MSADRAPVGALRLAHCGQELWLLPQRALWMPALATLLVADVHFDKAAALQRSGIALPEDDGVDDLDALATLLQGLPLRRLIVLGDLFHATPRPHSAALCGLQALLEGVRQQRPDFMAALVPGNHDRNLPPIRGLELWDEGTRLEGLELRHIPPATAGTAGVLTLAGHLHPGLVLGDRLDRLRLPAFWLRGEVLILPAFGRRTGLKRIPGHALEPTDRLFALLPEQVIAIPAGMVARARW